MFARLAEALAYIVALFYVSATPSIVVQTVPKQAPDSSAQVFSFSVRGVPHHDPGVVIPIFSPTLVSDPSTWQVSTQELGTSILKYEKDLVVIEQEGKIVATFQVSKHGHKDTKIVVKTPQPTELTCWGGGRATPNNDHATAQVGNRLFSTPGGFFNAIGLSIFVVVRNLTEKFENGNPLIVGARHPVYWTRTDARSHVYYAGGQDVDVYLSYSPTKESKDYLKFLWGITGKPVIPPVFALGFMASRWGWESSEYISQVLDQFDVQSVPIDAFIMDFEWYFNITGGDYLIPEKGLPDFPDFHFGNTKTFPDAQSQAREYRARNVRFGGIRKPRLGDKELIAMAHEKGWTMVRNLKQTRDLNFALPEVKIWYAQNTRVLLNEAGVPDFFWNDEGETSYFTYHHWIEAQQLADTSSNTERRFSLNRAFTPGMQRLEAAAVWTGDMETTWQSLKDNIDMLVRWSEAGAPWVTFDLGGFSGPQGPDYAELLIRWYQVGAFVGIMRVHSTLENTPHFPFSDLWGNQNAAIMREAIHLRYLMLPTIVAGMYSMRTEAIPWMTRKVPGTTNTAKDFLIANRTIFVVPVTEPMSNMTSLQVELPSEATWYPLGPGPAENRPVVTVVGLPLQDSLVYVKEGSVILLHGGPVDEATRATEIVGGEHTLLLKIFAHSTDQTAKYYATLVEDDGKSITGPRRITRFDFNQGALTLSWNASGDDNAPRWYNYIRVVYRKPDGDEMEAERSILPDANAEMMQDQIVLIENHPGGNNAKASIRLRVTATTA